MLEVVPPVPRRGGLLIRGDLREVGPTLGRNLGMGRGWPHLDDSHSHQSQEGQRQQHASDQDASDRCIEALRPSRCPWA